jgi:hypothetical protein
MFLATANRVIHLDLKENRREPLMGRNLRLKRGLGFASNDAIYRASWWSLRLMSESKIFEFPARIL